MDENLFWHIINDSKNENRQIFINNLIDNLSKFSKDEIYQFEIVLTENMKSLCTWNCFGALITIDTFGCDDAFDDFRSWIISQGKGFFQEFMQNGDSMASEIYRIFERKLIFSSAVLLSLKHKSNPRNAS